MADSITSPMHSRRETGLSGLADQLFDPLEVDALRSRVLARVFGAPTTSPRLGRYRVLDAIGRGAAAA